MKEMPSASRRSAKKWPCSALLMELAAQEANLACYAKVEHVKWSQTLPQHVGRLAHPPGLKASTVPRDSKSLPFLSRAGCYCLSCLELSVLFRPTSSRVLIALLDEDLVGACFSPKFQTSLGATRVFLGFREYFFTGQLWDVYTSPL